MSLRVTTALLWAILAADACVLTLGAFAVRDMVQERLEQERR